MEQGVEIGAEEQAEPCLSAWHGPGSQDEAQGRGTYQPLELTGTDWLDNYRVESYGGPSNCPATHILLLCGWLGG